MSDLARIKNNVRKMVQQNAPQEDIDGYIASEGATVEDVRNFREQAPPIPQPRPSEPIGQSEDIMRSAGAGVRAGIEGLGGMFGDIAQMQGDIAGWAAGKMGASTETQQSVSKWGRRLYPMPNAPSTAEIQGAITNPIVGESYKPQTIAGEYARTVGQFAPGAVMGPGGFMRKAAMTAIPAVASETAGQATKGTKAEPYARAAAAIVGGGFAAGSPRIPQKSPSATSSADLANETNRLYAASRAAGVTINAPSVDRLVNNIQMAAGRLNKDLRPNTAGVVDDALALKGKNLSLEELDEFRQVVGNSMARAQPQDVRTLTHIKKMVDNFADNVKPADIQGDIRGFEFIKEARKLNARKAKAEILSDLMERAKNQATGYENGLVIQLRALANNKDKLRAFSPQEQKLILSVVRRPTAHGVLRAMGMLAPNSTFGGIAGLGIAGSTGLIPGLVASGTGAAARYGAGMLTNRKMDLLQRSVSSGQPIPGPGPINRDALIRLLIASRSGEISARTNAPVR